MSKLNIKHNWDIRRVLRTSQWHLRLLRSICLNDCIVRQCNPRLSPLWSFKWTIRNIGCVSVTGPLPAMEMSGDVRSYEAQTWWNKAWCCVVCAVSTWTHPTALTQIQRLSFFLRDVFIWQLASFCLEQLIMKGNQFWNLLKPVLTFFVVVGMIGV